MHLESYISDLLYRFNCVTVPHFGSFLTQRVSATVHKSTNAFYPPKKQLSFNEQIQTNDGLLASYIADVEKITFETAENKIANRVTFLKTQLAEGKTIHLNNIGDLKLNTENRMVFEPSYHLNYLTHSFGLSQFVSPAIKREAYKQEAKVLEKTIPIALTPDKRKKLPYLKYAAIALLALCAGGLVTAKYYTNTIEAHNQMAQETANKQLENKIQEATFVIENPLPIVKLTLNKPQGNYHIIAGAFRVESNCDKKVAQLQNAGFTARKIGKNKYGLHQVAYASYSDRLEALQALRTIKKTNNKDAWLLVKNLNK